jgi:dimethylhistidine N-methyltransferase
VSTAALSTPQPRIDPGALTDVLEGLRQEPKRLPSRLFYDARGSRLFERICALPEYYLTRAELGILGRHAPEMAALIGRNAILVEFGSGTSQKTRVLLDALDHPAVYVPIDISSSVLYESARTLQHRYPQLQVRPVLGDYLQDLQLPLTEEERRAPIAAFFPGSTIGNFEPPDAERFLSRVRRELGPGGQLLIGVDLPKDPHQLEAAYDDASGVTAEFNLNILRVLNRDFAANFSTDDFRHRAVWNAAAGRVEMLLESKRNREVKVGPSRVSVRAGERIITEFCHKYSVDDFTRLAARAGLRGAEVWLDARRQFSVHLLVREDG